MFFFQSLIYKRTGINFFSEEVSPTQQVQVPGSHYQYNGSFKKIAEAEIPNACSPGNGTMAELFSVI